MSSQKSTPRPSAPRPGASPSRRRGHDRVAAIMDAAAAVFAVRGFDGATMAGIAAASNTAIGSLYRFFPTKDLLADALFARYAAAMDARIDALLPAVPSLSPFELAERLLRLIDGEDPDREAALVLADTSPAGADTRLRLRAGFRAGIAAILRAAGSSPVRAAAMAPVVVQVMKALPVLRHEGLDGGSVSAELRLLLAGYLAATCPAPPPAAAGAPSNGSGTHGDAPPF